MVEAMKKLVPLLAVLSLTNATGFGAETLRSGDYTIRQSWKQEQDYERPYLVSVPENKGGKLPVVVFLHGNGGNARGAMQGFLRRHRSLARRYIVVCPEGYQKSWNIVSERSKADDRAFVETIVQELAGYENVQGDNFSIIGSSNGAALVNQLAIECRLPNIRNYVSGVSPLNAYQHDGRAFKARGKNNSYRKTVEPLTGKRIMNISGTEDRLVPYGGGPSRVIPAKGGKLAFVDAEQSIFLWARAMGHAGKKLEKPTRVIGNLEVFSYLDGAVIHYKVAGAGHGAMGAIGEDLLIKFLEGGRREGSP